MWINGGVEGIRWKVQGFNLRVFGGMREVTWAL